MAAYRMLDYARENVRGLGAVLVRIAYADVVEQARAGRRTSMVILILLAGYDDRGQSVRLHLPVPWSGRTEGLVEGVRYANWRDTNPENVPARELQLTATAIPASADEAAPALPAAGEGMSAADTRALFTGIVPDPNMQRVLLELELER